jgi:hypothetical protein
MPRREHHGDRDRAEEQAGEDLEPGRSMPKEACDQVVQKDEDEKQRRVVDQADEGGSVQRPS